MPHVFTRRWGVRTVGDRVVDADTTTVELHAVELLDAPGSVLDGSHFYETKPTGPVRTYPLIVHDGDFFDSAEATELFIEVALLSANTKAEHTQHVGRIGRLNALSASTAEDSKSCTTIGACGGRRLVVVGGGVLRRSGGLR